jgi:predicted transcriptional regulator of viral defense system
MRFDELLSQCGTLPWFDYQTVLLLFPEGEESVRTSLYRHRRGGRVIELRRGFYAFAERYRPSSLPAPALAGILHAPSYLSELWALSWHGIIPEKAVIMTSVSPKPPATYDNTFGSYRYRSIKQALFWGYKKESIMGADVRIATPEKALIDLWHLEHGEWDEERLESMRIETRALDVAQVAEHASRSGSPRLLRAASALARLASSSMEGDEQL